MNTHAWLEENEARSLAPYAMHSRDSRGRVYPEEEAEYRTAFQRDRDRILHTTAFRRLEYKTQVFINHEGDYYRTRLTHSLEVAQLGRTLGRALAANEDLVEVICLAHDLGHPPFGHCGEKVLDELMRDHGGFDHNKQTLRIVTELERRYPDFPGLNLTWETREGIVKHETEYDTADAAGYDPGLRGNLEAQITNAADELAYISHDLDDGLRAGMITHADLLEVPLWSVLAESIGWDVRSPALDDLTRHRLIRRLISSEVGDLLEHTSANLKASGVRSVGELQRLPNNVVAFGEEMLAHNRVLKDFLFRRLYRHHRVMRVQVKSERIVKALWQVYLDEPGTLPAHVRALCGACPPERVVCDYIAGMTDRFAIQEYERIFEPQTLAGGDKT